MTEAIAFGLMLNKEIIDPWPRLVATPTFPPDDSLLLDVVLILFDGPPLARSVDFPLGVSLPSYNQPDPCHDKLNILLLHINPIQ